jgi:O-6-methylguanine DNA methyltransferase
LVRDLQDQFPKAELIGADREFESMVAKVVGFIEAPRTGFNLPLDVRGTAFQLRVWQALRKIPAGSTVSYRDIAERIGAPKAVRAVAQACASNHIAVAIPCHRVLRDDGALSGYRWGVERKSAPKKRGGVKMSAVLTDRRTHVADRVAGLDWQHIVGDLDDYGCGVAKGVLTPKGCRELALCYDQDQHFRSRIVMARHGFGRGEYKY